VTTWFYHRQTIPNNKKTLLLISRFVTIFFSNIELHISCKPEHKFVFRNRI